MHDKNLKNKIILKTSQENLAIKGKTLIPHLPISMFLLNHISCLIIWRQHLQQERPRMARLTISHVTTEN